MADFYQTGMVTTLHRLNPDGLARIEAELEQFARQTSLALVLPALYTEFETPAMRRISDQLSRVRYLRQIVVALGRATASQHEAVRCFFRGFGLPVTLLWVDGRPVQDLLALLEDRGLSAGPDG